MGVTLGRWGKTILQQYHIKCTQLWNFCFSLYLSLPLLFDTLSFTNFSFSFYFPSTYISSADLSSILSTNIKYIFGYNEKSIRWLKRFCNHDSICFCSLPLCISVICIITIYILWISLHQRAPATLQILFLLSPQISIYYLPFFIFRLLSFFLPDIN